MFPSLCLCDCTGHVMFVFQFFLHGIIFKIKAKPPVWQCWVNMACYCQQQISCCVLTSCLDHSFSVFVRSPETSVSKVATVRIYHSAAPIAQSDREIWTRCRVRHHKPEKNKVSQSSVWGYQIQLAGFASCHGRHSVEIFLSFSLYLIMLITWLRYKDRT